MAQWVEGKFQLEIVGSSPAQLFFFGLLTICLEPYMCVHDWLISTSRPGGCSQPRELWFTDILL